MGTEDASPGRCSHEDRLGENFSPADSSGRLSMRAGHSQRTRGRDFGPYLWPLGCIATSDADPRLLRYAGPRYHPDLGTITALLVLAQALLISAAPIVRGGDAGETLLLSSLLSSPV